MSVFVCKRQIGRRRCSPRSCTSTAETTTLVADRQSHPIQTVYINVWRSTRHGTSLPHWTLRALFWHWLTF